ncbi:MAG: C45 family autoproteolytic acyltransferase/hydrolase [Bacillota bacterium]
MINKKLDNTDFIEVNGSSTERGYQYGRKSKVEIKKTIDFFHNWFKHQGNNINKTRNISTSYSTSIENYSPAITAELKGIAEGAEVDFSDILMISLNEERQLFINNNNCTSFAATGNATFNNRTILGQTWDNYLEWHDNFKNLILIRRSDQNPDIISYTYPGMLAAAGLNSSGIAVCWNSVPRLKLQLGVPTYIIIDEILRQTTLGNALTAVMRATRAGCFNLVLSDEKEIYNIEATPDDIEISYSTNYLSHANHYLSERFASQEPEPNNLEKYKRKASSIIRHNRMTKFLEKEASKISTTSGQKFLQDHLNQPHSICRHPDLKSDYSDKFLTRAAWVIDPTNKVFWYAEGPPCKNQFLAYKL